MNKLIPFVFLMLLSAINTLKAFDPPTLTLPTLPVVICDYSTDCAGNLDLTITATNHCPTSDVLTFGYTLYLDLDGDGIMETIINFNNPITTSSNGATTTAQVHLNDIPYGTHKIKWFAQDSCDQISDTEYLFEIKDCKNPSILVDNGIVINFMVLGLPITIWPGDPFNCTAPAPDICAWDPSVGDNCTPDDEIRFRIRKLGTGTGVPFTESVTYTCADIGINYVEIWAGDNADNWDSTVTSVIIEGTPCDPWVNQVQGIVTTPSNQGIKNTTVTLSNSSEYLTTKTDFSGTYTFPTVPYGNYVIKPTKTDNPTNGVNILDILYLYQAILGIELNSPYQKIAADVNVDGNIDIIDLLTLRALILGIIDDFPDVDSWVFLNESCDSLPCSPYMINVDSINPNFSVDFIGLKMGDINGDAIPNYHSVDDRTAGEFVLNTKDQFLQAGEEVEITLQANRSDILGYQFTLDIGSMEFVDVVGADVSFDKNFALHDGALTASWFGELSNKEVFTVTLKATQDTRLSRELSINSRITQSMAFDSDEQKQTVKLSFNGKTKSLFELYQNEPNPFSNSTNIQFFLPESTMATLTVYNTNGQILKTIKGEYPKGMNQVSFAKADLKATGVLYYKLATEFGTKVKRMVIVE